VTNTKERRTVVPRALVPGAIRFFHDLSLHSGRSIMLLILRRHYFFFPMEELVSDYVKSCGVCGKYKVVAP